LRSEETTVYFLQKIFLKLSFQAFCYALYLSDKVHNRMLENEGAKRFFAKKTPGGRRDAKQGLHRRILS